MTGTFLRPPPFPGSPLRVSERSSVVRPVPQDTLALLVSEKVGGAFWSCPASSTTTGTVIVRCPKVDRAALVSTASSEGGGAALWVEYSDLPDRAEPDAPDPWASLATAAQLFAHGDDEWVAIATLCDVPVTLLSDGVYGAAGDSPEHRTGRLVRQLGSERYLDPFSGDEIAVTELIAIMGDWRRQIESNRTIAAATGMAWWKRHEIGRFLWLPERTVPILRNPRKAIARARDQGGKLAVWPSRISPQMADLAAAQGVELVRIEDGFIRSAGLGSDLVPPSSVVVDQRGIHFDPSAPSDLEHILSTTAFSPALLARARALREAIVARGISKYAATRDEQRPRRPADRRVVLVAAQVEDDMSVLAGGGGITSNLEVLRRARACEPDAEIWYRPHPDIEAGHRVGAVDDHLVRHYADRIVRDGTMAPLLDTVDAVHVLTSLTGFEALLRGRVVTCHGTPFYAGWGLTTDLGPPTRRRGRNLSLDELVAGVLIIYPRYLDPVSHLPCPVEVLVARMAAGHAANRLDTVSRLRRWQGRVMARLR